MAGLLLPAAPTAPPAAPTAPAAASTAEVALTEVKTEEEEKEETAAALNSAEPVQMNISSEDDLELVEPPPKSLARTTEMSMQRAQQLMESG
eukprot:5201049-Alexandrium_andersonii.AAC.1